MVDKERIRRAAICCDGKGCLECPYYDEETGKACEFNKDVLAMMDEYEKDLKISREYAEFLGDALEKKREIMDAEEAEALRILRRNDGMIGCQNEPAPPGQDVILIFHDTYHTHPSWPKIAIAPAWRCNVGEDDSKPYGQWAIDGRLGGYVVDYGDGICWMPLPDIDPELYLQKALGGQNDNNQACLIEKQNSMLRALFNRCRAVVSAGGAMCSFCSIRDECHKALASEGE